MILKDMTYYDISNETDTIFFSNRERLIEYFEILEILIEYMNYKKVDKKKSKIRKKLKRVIQKLKNGDQESIYSESVLEIRKEIESCDIF